MDPVVRERVRGPRPAYRPFATTVSRVRVLSPSFTRVTLTGPDLDVFGTAGLDQRIKLLLPLPPGQGRPQGLDHLGLTDPAVAEDGSWYARWRALPEAERNPLRTYTVRSVRASEREIDVDVVVHGPDEHGHLGPAARWVATVLPGDELVVVGPDDRSDEWRCGLDWRPGPARRVLLAGDETAAPAICAVLESLGRDVVADAFIEVPHADDRLPVSSPARARVTWLPRCGAGSAHDGGGGDPTADHRARGRALREAVAAWVARHGDVLPTAPCGASREVDDSDVEAGLLWDSPGEDVAPGGPTEPGRPTGPAASSFYAWIAGETTLVRDVRRCLVTGAGVDRSRVAFMGYWRLGRGERS